MSALQPERIWCLDVPPLQKLVLLALARAADRAGTCTHEMAMACLGQTGLSAHQVNRVLTRLFEEGFVVVYESGPWTYGYRLNLPLAYWQDTCDAGKGGAA